MIELETFRPWGDVADTPMAWQLIQNVPEDNIWVLLRDIELTEKWRKDRPADGRPQTVNFHTPPGSREMFPMTSDLENFFMSLTPDFPTNKLEQICDAFFILGSKYYQGSPKYPGYLGFGGDTVRCIGQLDGMLMIEAVNPANLPNSNDFTSYADYRPDSLLKLPLTTTQGEHTNRFPHNDGKDLFGMLLSDVGYLLIEPERCRPVAVPEYPYR